MSADTRTRFSSSTCVTGGRMSADEQVTATLFRTAQQYVLDGHAALGASSMIVVTDGTQRAPRDLASAMTALEPTCFKCQYSGHVRRQCPLARLL